MLYFCNIKKNITISVSLGINKTFWGHISFFSDKGNMRMHEKTTHEGFKRQEKIHRKLIPETGVSGVDPLGHITTSGNVMSGAINNRMRENWKATYFFIISVL